MFQSFTKAYAHQTQPNGFRKVVKPFSHSKNKFYQTSVNVDQASLNEASLNHTIPQKSSGVLQITDRNFTRASKSSLSKTRHNQASLYLRELQVVFKKDQ